MIRFIGLCARLALGAAFGWVAACSAWIAYAPDGCLVRTPVTAGRDPVTLPPVDVWWTGVSRLVEVSTPHGQREYLVGPEVTVEISEREFIATNADFRFISAWGPYEMRGSESEHDIDIEADEAEAP